VHSMQITHLGHAKVNLKN